MKQGKELTQFDQDLKATKAILRLLAPMDNNTKRRVLAAVTCLRSQEAADWVISTKGVR